jgi:hypothetical protein
MTSWECYENKWFYMKYTGKMAETESLLSTCLPWTRPILSVGLITSCGSWCYQLTCSKQKWLHYPKMSLIVIPIFVHPVCHKSLEQYRQRHQKYQIKHNVLRSRLLDNFSHPVSWYKEFLLEYAVNPVTIHAASSCIFLVPEIPAHFIHLKLTLKVKLYWLKFRLIS